LSVLSPSDIATVVGHEEPCTKRGLTLKRVDATTTGPEPWKPTQQAAIQCILYSVAVPHWLSEAVQKDEDYTYDNAFQRENDQAFSEGMRSLFDYLSRWTDKRRPISLDVVLQAENVYTSDQDAEPETDITDGTEELIAPCRAKFIQDCHLATVSCISSLDFHESWIPAGMGCENRISPGAALKIASACGGNALRKVELEDDYQISPVDAALAIEKRESTAIFLSRLPSSVRRLDIQWSAYPGEYEVPSVHYPLPAVFLRPDALPAALHDVSLHLKELRINELDVLPEFFCPSHSESQSSPNWANLEILHVTGVPCYTPFGDELRFAESGHSRDVLVKSYFDEFYASVGFAVQRMPKLKHLSTIFGIHDLELDLVVCKGRGALGLNFNGSYELPPSVMQAWKLYTGQLRKGHGGWFKAEYETWPPS
jgi:hypothetical protein